MTTNATTIHAARQGDTEARATLIREAIRKGSLIANWGYTHEVTGFIWSELDCDDWEGVRHITAVVGPQWRAEGPLWSQPPERHDLADLMWVHIFEDEHGATQYITHLDGWGVEEFDDYIDRSLREYWDIDEDSVDAWRESIRDGDWRAIATFIDLVAGYHGVGEVDCYPSACPRPRVNAMFDDGLWVVEVTS